MTASGWRQSVIDYIRVEAQPVDKFGHQPRLYALATEIGVGLDYDDDVVFAAAWMHDLGVFLNHRPANTVERARWNDVPYTIARARELLPAWGFPPHKLDAVAEAINTHQPHNDPVLIEAIILRDADILEQLGAIGALRAIAKVGRDTRYVTFSDIVPVLQTAADNLPDQLKLTKSRVLAALRVDNLRAFLASIHKEAGNLLF